MNKIELLGRLTADPELKTVSGNISMVKFCVAVNRRYARPEDKQTDFINCTAWRKTAEFICKYFKKGQFIGVCGSLLIDTWEGADGKMKHAANVAVEEVDFGGGTGKNDQNGDIKSSASEAPASTEEEINTDWVTAPSEDNLPF